MYNLCNTGCVYRNRCNSCGCSGNTWTFQRICRDSQGNIRVINNRNSGCGCGCSQGWNTGCNQTWNTGCNQTWSGGFGAWIVPTTLTTGTGYNGCQRTCGATAYNGYGTTRCGGCVNALTVTNDAYYARLYGLTGSCGTTRCGCTCGNAYTNSTAYVDTVDATDD